MQDASVSFVHSVARSASEKFGRACVEIDPKNVLNELALQVTNGAPLPSSLEMFSWLLAQESTSDATFERTLINIAAAHVRLDALLRTWKHTCSLVLGKAHDELRAQLLKSPEECKQTLTAMALTSKSEDKPTITLALRLVDALEEPIKHPSTGVVFSVHECAQLMSMSAHIVALHRVDVVVPTKWRMWCVLSRYMDISVPSQKVTDDQCRVNFANVFHLVVAMHKKLMQDCCAVAENTLPVCAK